MWTHHHSRLDVGLVEVNPVRLVSVQLRWLWYLHVHAKVKVMGEGENARGRGGALLDFLHRFWSRRIASIDVKHSCTVTLLVSM